MLAVRWKLVPLTLFVGFALVNAIGASAGRAASPPKELRLASIISLGPGMNVEDSRLAIEVLMQKTLVRKTDPYRVKLSLLSGLDQIEPAMSRDRFHFLALTGLDYAELRQSLPLTPLIILSKNDAPTETLLLVSQKNQGLGALAKKEKRVVVLDDTRVGDLSRLWLDTVLWDAGLPASEGFFSTLKRATRPGQLLLPVFFGQADACVITASAFALMAEFNPQIEKRLAPLMQSPELVSLLLCATEHAAPQDRELVLSDVNTMDQDPTVRQALTIVQMKRLIPFRREYFEATETLIEKYRLLEGKQTGGSP